MGEQAPQATFMSVFSVPRHARRRAVHTMGSGKGQHTPNTREPQSGHVVYPKSPTPHTSFRAYSYSPGPQQERYYEAANDACSLQSRSGPGRVDGAPAQRAG